MVNISKTYCTDVGAQDFSRPSDCICEDDLLLKYEYDGECVLELCNRGVGLPEWAFHLVITRLLGDSGGQQAFAGDTAAAGRGLIEGCRGACQPCMESAEVI